MAPYSMNLRQRVARAWDAGLDADTIAAKYEVSRAWVHRLIQRRRETGSLRPRKQTKFRRRGVGRSRSQAGRAHRGAAGCDARRDPRGAPDLGRLEHAVVRDRSIAVDGKKTVHADEQRRPDIVAARRRWYEWLPLRDVRHYVFLDECG